MKHVAVNVTLFFIVRCWTDYLRNTVKSAPCLRGDELYQRPSKFGKRFSKNAFMPSFCAGVPNPAWK